jgi:hydroxymethylbilane synthase
LIEGTFKLRVRRCLKAPSVLAGARSSPLSRAQVAEITSLVAIELVPVWVETLGDKDGQTSLRSLAKTDFFTREIDQMVLDGSVRIGIHSAKDLPCPMVDGLCVAAVTPSIDPRDALVMQDGLSIDRLAPHALIATSSERRERAALLLRSDFRFQDLRGTVGERLNLLKRGDVDGVIIAEAALIRLGLTHLTREYLPGETVEGQGQLAVVCRCCDLEMITLFKKIECASCT